MSQLPFIMLKSWRHNIWLISTWSQPFSYSVFVALWSPIVSLSIMLFLGLFILGESPTTEFSSLLDYPYYDNLLWSLFNTAVFILSATICSLALNLFSYPLKMWVWSAGFRKSSTFIKFNGFSSWAWFSSLFFNKRLSSISKVSLATL